MKKLLMVAIALIASVNLFGQQTEIEQRIIQVFRETYVEKNFKDPYSFKLLKIEATPVTRGQWLQNDIDYMNKVLSEGKEIYESKDEFIARKVKYENELSSLDFSIRNSIHAYVVEIDCYGNNSYGNPILGRYRFNYRPELDYSKVTLYVRERK